MNETAKNTTERAYKGISKAQRQEMRREALIRAAIEVFGTKGYARSTVKAICTEAKLTERYFYESFRNKEALLHASYQAVAEELQSALINSVDIAQKNPFQAAQDALTVFFEFMHHQRAKARLFMLEVMGVSETMDKTYRQYATDMDALILASAGANIDTGNSQWNTNIVAQGLTGAVTNITIQWILHNYNHPLEDVINSSLMVFESTLQSLQNQTSH